MPSTVQALYQDIPHRPVTGYQMDQSVTWRSLYHQSFLTKSVSHLGGLELHVHPGQHGQHKARRLAAAIVGLGYQVAVGRR